MKVDEKKLPLDPKNSFWFYNFRQEKLTGPLLICVPTFLYSTREVFECCPSDIIVQLYSLMDIYKSVVTKYN